MKDTQPILNLKITTMKKVIKSYMMAIVAVMLVAGFSAFKVTETVTVDFGLLHTVDENNQPIIEYIKLDQMQEDIDYSCESSSNICKERFDESDLDEDGLPKEGASSVAQESGTFVLF